jgi:hypothetical protein
MIHSTALGVAFGNYTVSLRHCYLARNKDTYVERLLSSIVLFWQALMVIFL